MGNFWGELKDFAKRIKVDSVTVGPARLKLAPKQSDDAFGQLITLTANTEKRNDVFVLSAHNVDEVTQVDRIDADHECEALSTPIRLPGGAGANSAFALGRLGAKVEISGIVGSDTDGEMLIASLIAAYVNTENLCVANNYPTGRTNTLVEKGGQRFIVVYPGVNSVFAKTADVDRLADAALASRIVHLSSFVGSAELRLQQQLVERIGNQSLVSLTPGALYAKRGLDRLKDLIKHVDVMFIYREQLFKLLENSSAKPQLSDASTQQLLEEYFGWRQRNGLSTPHTVLVKDPLQNTFGHIDQRFMSVGSGSDRMERFFGPMEIPANADLVAVDTTGTGDAAAAGFLYAMLQSASLDDCVDSAFLLACFASTRVGARTAFEESLFQDGGPINLRGQDAQNALPADESG